MDVFISNNNACMHSSNNVGQIDTDPVHADAKRAVDAECHGGQQSSVNESDLHDTSFEGGVSDQVR